MYVCMCVHVCVLSRVRIRTHLGYRSATRACIADHNDVCLKVPGLHWWNEHEILHKLIGITHTGTSC